ncbi:MULTISPECIES: ribonuclease E/G [unclassified Brevundimonas]|uniref:Rne/Rng family ribonuclease n=1 Tax=unclassified Brevundimonas TaxID=2622653 RepID=UPI000CFD77FF|nr:MULTISPECIES: ribonuclease E/G [unclassified Brevundimonas]PRA26304.1 ribonuclease E/G [Brevundimonas sp. MYb27]PQZ80621.1 ribonuclease E/G [Brevundimonas sp. MYb31]PRB16903.1 ribonuclease E/G [Brevundimonas sp. MYb52]PRB37381.1 ribonuclease E/G [Brevundimonas sp. MYb46]PRB54885.1 ribonuclease E/G [Brevundimonas sp. MYb33]
MSKTMLIDAAHAEETRVAIVDGRQVEEFDFESTARRQLRGNIYLAKVTRVEPSLQAAFIEYGGNRHGFLAFNEIHPDYYQIPVADREAIMAEANSDDDDHDDLGREGDDESEGGLADEERLKRRLMRRYKIQDVIKRRQILLVQVVKDERGAKGAALTTWLSLAGRYCVLMPNTGKGGGISRKITNTSDRRRLKAAASALKVPKGMGLIIRTAGAKRTKAEIKRDYEYLLRLWETIRETTLKSNAPAVIYEEENLVRRAVRDMYDKDFDGIQVEGLEGFKEARDFMRVLMPSQAKKIHLYQGSKPLFAANGIEEVLTQIHQPVVPLKSGGYLVINQTEALVAIDVNSGRSTKERNVEATATKTNLEAAVEAARQLRLRDLAGLIVIDFIDMDEGKNNRAVEKALKDALAKDRARIQMGRISGFGLMEISRQRRRLGVIEGATEVCACCQGAGRIRSAESAALTTLRAVDIEAGRNGAGSVNLRVSTAVALYILNHKRSYLQRLLEQRGLNVVIQIDDSLAQGEHAIERTSTNEDFIPVVTHISAAELDDGFDDSAFDHEDEDEDDEVIEGDDEDDADLDREDGDDDEARERSEQHDGEGRGRGRRRRRRGGRRDEETSDEAGSTDVVAADDEDDDSEAGRRRRRGRRGGRRMREDGERDAFTWVRGRTPSLDDPYVWFDPINPAPRSERAPAETSEAGDVVEATAERPEGERAEREGGRSRRRRGRGRGRDRSGLAHEAKVEDRAVNEGLPPVGSPDTPIATIIPTEEAVADAPEVVAEPVEAPKRRRVRRKVSADVASEAVIEAPAESEVAAEAPVEAEPVAVPAQLDVEPAVAAKIEAAIEQALEPEAVAEPAPEPAIVVEPTPEPTPEVDVAAIIAEDPNQIVAPPAKPKRGWWRR